MIFGISVFDKWSRSRRDHAGSVLSGAKRKMRRQTTSPAPGAGAPHPTPPHAGGAGGREPTTSRRSRSDAMLAGDRWPGENQEGQTRGPSNHRCGSGLYKWGARGAALGRRPMRKDTVEMRGPRALWGTTGVQGSGRDRWRVAGRGGGRCGWEGAEDRGAEGAGSNAGSRAALPAAVRA